jgi:hypothetical protein
MVRQTRDRHGFYHTVSGSTSKPGWNGRESNPLRDRSRVCHVDAIEPPQRRYNYAPNRFGKRPRPEVSEAFPLWPVVLVEIQNRFSGASGL